MKYKLKYPRVLLINLPGVEQGGYCPSPLGILYLAAYLRKHAKGVIVDIVDGAVEGDKVIIGKLKKFKPNLVGISVLTPSRNEAIRFAILTKRINPHCKIVFGGIHPTLMGEQMMFYYPVVDYIVKGEGEETLLELVTDKDLKDIKGLMWRKEKDIVNNPNRPMIQDLNNIPFPAWDLIDLMKYPARGKGEMNGINLEAEVRVPLIFSRGCMGSCTFCSTWQIWKGYRSRGGKNVADEVEVLVKKYGAKHFVFQDDTLTGNREEIIKFCQEIIKRKLKVAIIGCTRVDYVDEKLLQLMQKAGVYELSYGIESGSPSMLLKMNKKTDLKKIIKAAEITKKSNIRFCALMMRGLPGETEKDKRLSDKLMKRIKPDDIGSLGEVWIFPGTALYLQAKKAKLLDDRFWLGRRPYYIYRGGMEGDKLRRNLLLRDWYESNIEKTSFGKVFNPFLWFKRKYFNVVVYHLRLRLASSLSSV